MGHRQVYEGDQARAEHQPRHADPQSPDRQRLGHEVEGDHGQHYPRRKPQQGAEPVSAGSGQEHRQQPPEARAQHACRKSYKTNFRYYPHRPVACILHWVFSCCLYPRSVEELYLCVQRNYLYPRLSGGELYQLPLLIEEISRSEG